MNRKAKRERMRRVHIAAARLTIARTEERQYATAYWIGRVMVAKRKLRKAWGYGR